MFRISFLVKDNLLAELLHTLPEGKCYALEVQPVTVEAEAVAQPQPQQPAPDKKPRANRNHPDNHSATSRQRIERRQQVVANAIASMPSEFGTSDLFAEISKAEIGVGSTYMYKQLREEIDAGRIIRLDTGVYRKLGAKPAKPSKAAEQQPTPTPTPETPAETRGFPFWR